MKFLPGSKVRCINGKGVNVNTGSIYTVQCYYNPELPDYISVEERSGFYSVNRFVLHEEDCIENLILKANEGLAAIKELKSNYGNDCRCLFDDDALTLAFYTLPNSVERFHEQKQLMVTSNGWTVVMDGSNIKVGCKEFSVKGLMDILCRFLVYESSRHDDYAATHKGIIDTKSNHVLLWKDAKTLYNILVAELGEGTLIA